MSLEKLLEKIQADGATEAEAILAQARDEAGRIKREAAEESEAIRQAQVKDAELLARRHQLRIMSAARMSARMRVLEVKRELLDQVAVETAAKIEKMTDEVYRAWLKDLLLESIRTGREELLPAAVDRSLLDAKFLAEINEALQASGREGRVTVSAQDSRSVLGIVLREGGIETDLSVAALLAQAFEAGESELAKILFGERS